MSKEGAERKKNSISPCAACKLLRRRCAKECVFAPYFPSDDPHKFATVHRVFGASNVNKMLKELPVQNRADAVSSMVYEANARIRDPVYGCVGTIFSLQQQLSVLQAQLALAQAEAVQLRMHHPNSHVYVSNFLGGLKEDIRDEDQKTTTCQPLWTCT
ncbi:hypothetical protein SUGI_0446900 [Cryptomeria japonica]|nr:hypothetical protein SUGI_0446900 [Cryptomeria japonica]